MTTKFLYLTDFYVGVYTQQTHLLWLKMAINHTHTHKTQIAETFYANISASSQHANLFLTPQDILMENTKKFKHGDSLFLQINDLSRHYDVT